MSRLATTWQALKRPKNSLWKWYKKTGPLSFNVNCLSSPGTKTRAGHYAEVHCKPSTVAFYKQFHRLYIFPEFGVLRMNAIARDHVKRFVGCVAAKGLSKNTIGLVIASLRPLFNAAIEDGIIQLNPAARLGRFIHTRKPERRASALTREETEAVLKTSREHRARFYLLFMTALGAGFRLGELLALTWADINCGQDEADSKHFIIVRRRFYAGTSASRRAIETGAWICRKSCGASYLGPAMLGCWQPSKRAKTQLPMSWSSCLRLAALLTHQSSSIAISYQHSKRQNSGASVFVICGTLSGAY
ncbi:MAG: phage integrase SAM-like domain-containing protein [Acidobacteriota bacterium]